MRDMAVAFLYFQGCPLAPRARANLVAALARVGRGNRFSLEEVDLMAPETPEHLKGWGSPTILIDNSDIMGASPGSARNCRIYASHGGVPSEDEIVAAIEARLGE